jgi:hypothetical protein
MLRQMSVNNVGSVKLREAKSRLSYECGGQRGKKEED